MPMAAFDALDHIWYECIRHYFCVFGVGFVHSSRHIIRVKEPEDDDEYEEVDEASPYAA